MMTECAKKLEKYNKTKSKEDKKIMPEKIRQKRINTKDTKNEVYSSAINYILEKEKQRRQKL